MFVAGPYNAVADDTDLGICEDGYDLEQTPFQEAIRGDNLGGADIDHVYRGANCFLSWIVLEWDRAYTARVFWPWDATFGVCGVIGGLASNFAQEIILTVVDTATTANSQGPNTVTCPVSVLAADNTIKHHLGTRLRKLPMRHQLYPTTSQNVTRWFSVS